MTNDLGPSLAAIVAMALATYAVRVSGYWVMGHVPVTPRVRRMLETLPGAIVVATVAPLVAKAGVPGALGIGATLAAMILSKNEFLAVAVGLGTVALARFAGI